MKHKNSPRPAYERKETQNPEIKTASPAEVKAALEKISDQVKEAGEKAINEAKKGVAMSEETKGRVDELLTKQGELIERMSEIEQKQEREKGNQGQETKSVGNQFIESEGFKNFQNARGPGKFHLGFKAVTDITSATTGTGAGGALVQNQVVESPMMTPGQRRLTIRDLIAKGRTNSNTIEYVQETGFQNMAAAQAGEGAAKAQSDIAFTDATAAVITIAHWIRTSKQILSDAPRLQSYIDGRMRYGLKLVEENQILMGAGGANNLNGIYTQATAYSQPAGGYGGGKYQDGTTVIAVNAIDILRLALLQAELAEYPSDGIVLNPTQWGAIETLKDASGRYIIGNPQGTLSPTLWSRPVVATQAMTTDKFLVGSFGMGAEVFDREDAAVLVSTEDQDNFIKNKVTILAEERLALAVYRPEAFIKGDLGFI